MNIFRTRSVCPRIPTVVFDEFYSGRPKAHPSRYGLFLWSSKLFSWLFRTYYQKNIWEFVSI